MKLSHYTKKIAAAVCAFSALISALFSPNYLIASAANSYRYGEFMVQDQADGSMLLRHTHAIAAIVLLLISLAMSTKTATLIPEMLPRF